MHWIAGAPPRTSRLVAKTRYRMPDASCVLEPPDPTETTRSGWRARFDAPQWAPTPGQYLVAYDGDVCLGGAVIESNCNEDAISVGRHAEGVAV
jgi:tRNA-specific 2-thiouridylase